MKRNKILLKTVCLVATFLLPICLYSQVNFSKAASWKAVLEQAKVESKYIFVDIGATWCGPCRMMDTQVFSNTDVGKFLNEQFISVKVQTDKTDSDDELTRSWYADAKLLSDTYQIAVMPTQLYFAPDGKLVYRQSGYQSAGNVLRAARFSTDPKLKDVGQVIEDYKNGRRDYTGMVSAINVVTNVLRDLNLGRQMTADYNKHYLNLQSDTTLVLTADNIEAAYRLKDTLQSSDQIIKMIRAAGVQQVEKYAGNTEGKALALLQYFVEKDELEGSLFDKDKVKVSKPDWDKMERAIKQKYPDVNVASVIDRYRIGYGQLGKPSPYLRMGNYKLMNKYMGIQVDKHLKDKELFSVNAVCWDQYVTRVTDKSSLELAIRWMDRAFSVADTTHDVSYAIDTKAVLYYKLGRQKLAIKSEEEAVASLRRFNISNGHDKEQGVQELQQVIEQMKRGEKIYAKSAVYPADWKLLD